MKTILIVGATGFLGSHIARRLAQTGHRVLAASRATSDRGSLDGTGIQWFDLADDGLEAALTSGHDVDAVVFTVATFARNGEDAAHSCGVNTLLPLKLLEASIRHAVPVFLNADTAIHYVLNPYSLSKRHFSEWGRLLAKDGGMRFVDLRLEHLYGPGDDDSKFPAFVIGKCLRNEPELALTRGEQRRDFVFIDDVVDAYMLLLDAVTSLDPGFHEFSIGSGESVRVQDFVQLVVELTGSTTRPRFGALEYRSHEVMHSSAELEAIGRLGWSPRTALEDGLRITIEAERLRCGY